VTTSPTSRDLICIFGVTAASPLSYTGMHTKFRSPASPVCSRDIALQINIIVVVQFVSLFTFSAARWRCCRWYYITCVSCPLGSSVQEAAVSSTGRLNSIQYSKQYTLSDCSNNSKEPWSKINRAIKPPTVQ